MVAVVAAALVAAPAAVGAGVLSAGASSGPAAPASHVDLSKVYSVADDGPYRGWSSWSMQSSHYPGLNDENDYQWLTERNVLAQAKALARTLKPYGYDHVNIDAGWWSDFTWKPGYDAHGRQTPNAQRFPRGMAPVAADVHRLGLKAGIYLPVGLEKPAYDDGDYPIAGAPGCSTHDIVYSDKRTTNGWDSSYKIDFEKPCAQKYVDSQAAEIAGWGYDLLKLDGVGPGSGKSGDQYDNRADVEAWHEAIARTGRDVQLEVSWSLDKGAIDTWQDAADGWRIDTDVECYCDTLVSWTNSVDDRFADAPSWVRYAGKGGWNNLDSLDVGNGRMDGLTDDERRSYATLWAISAAPLYTGDDLTKLDRLGRQLLTNREVLAIDAQGRAASPVVPKALQQVWRVQNADGSWTVALFNLDRQPAHVQARWSDVGFAGPARVRDVWSGRSLGRFAGGWSADVPGHGVRLLNVRPEATPVTVQAESSTSTLVGGAKVGGCDGCAGGLKVGDMGEGDSVTLHGFHVARAGTYAVTVSYVDASNGRDVGIAVDGGAVQKVRLGAGDDDRWDRPQSTTLHLPLRAGENSITFSNVGGYTPDVDQVTVQRVS
ncbi:hypothetical protein GCM10028814_03050 [Angustibacter aerolatus]